MSITVTISLLPQLFSGLNSLIMTLAAVGYMIGPPEKIQYVLHNCFAEM